MVAHKKISDAVSTYNKNREQLETIHNDAYIDMFKTPMIEDRAKKSEYDKFWRTLKTEKNELLGFPKIDSFYRFEKDKILFSIHTDTNMELIFHKNFKGKDVTNRDNKGNKVDWFFAEPEFIEKWLSKFNEIVTSVISKHYGNNKHSNRELLGMNDSLIDEYNNLIHRLQQEKDTLNTKILYSKVIDCGNTNEQVLYIYENHPLLYTTNQKSKKIGKLKKVCPDSNFFKLLKETVTTLNEIVGVFNNSLLQRYNKAIGGLVYNSKNVCKKEFENYLIDILGERADSLKATDLKDFIADTLKIIEIKAYIHELTVFNRQNETIFNQLTSATSNFSVETEIKESTITNIHFYEAPAKDGFDTVPKKSWWFKANSKFYKCLFDYMKKEKLGASRIKSNSASSNEESIADLFRSMLNFERTSSPPQTVKRLREKQAGALVVRRSSNSQSDSSPSSPSQTVKRLREKQAGALVVRRSSNSQSDSSPSSPSQTKRAKLPKMLSQKKDLKRSRELLHHALIVRRSDTSSSSSDDPPRLLAPKRPRDSMNIVRVTK